MDMDKEQFKATLAELIAEGEIDLHVTGDSTQYSHTITVGLSIDKEIVTETEVRLEKEW